MPKSISSISLRPTGFSLVELSIVLVILGLLVGGVLSGQSLIRAAELRSVVSEYQSYAAAVKSFNDKYFAIPGDMATATSFWGAADGSTGLTAACFNTAGTGTQTCNGDGSGLLNQTTASNEIFRFWQHLANAGLIEGSYTGIQGGSNTMSADTTNSRAGRISASLWTVFNFGTASHSTNMFDGQYGNSFAFTGQVVNNLPRGTPIFKPEEAWNIDTKIDDGQPANGAVVIYVTNTPVFATCTDASASSTLTANYNLSTSTPTCALIFRNQF